MSYLEEGDQKFVAGLLADGEVRLWWTEGENERRERVRVEDGRVTTLAVGRTGTVIAGTDKGEVLHWELGESARLTDVTPTGSPVTALAYLIGNRTFITGGADGRVSAWFQAPVGPNGDLAMVRGGEFEPQGSPVTAIAPSGRDRSFATASADGRIVLRHQTSGRTLVTLEGTGGRRWQGRDQVELQAAWRYHDRVHAR